MNKQEMEKLKKEHSDLKIKLKNAKCASTSLKIENRMSEINKILTKELGTALW